MRVVIGNQLYELQRWTAKGAVEQDGQRLHQHSAQQVTAQMPQIVRPDPLDIAPADDLAEEGVKEVAHKTEYGAVARMRIACRRAVGTKSSTPHTCHSVVFAGDQQVRSLTTVLPVCSA